MSNFNIHIARGSISDPLDRTILLWNSQSKLNKSRDLNTKLYWWSYTITQLHKSVSHECPYLNRALTANDCANYNDSLRESALLVECWTIRYLVMNTLSTNSARLCWATNCTKMILSTDSARVCCRVGHPFFSKERSDLCVLNVPIFAFFSILYKRTEESLRSFPFFIKECSDLCVLFRSL